MASQTNRSLAFNNLESANDELGDVAAKADGANDQVAEEVVEEGAAKAENSDEASAFADTALENRMASRDLDENGADEVACRSRLRRQARPAAPESEEGTWRFVYGTVG